MKFLRNFILFIIFASFASVLLLFRGHSAIAQGAGQQGAAAQPANGVSVQAIVPSTTVAIGKPFELIVRVKTTSEGDAVAEPRMPDLEGFQVIGRDQRTSSQMSIINGDVQSQVIRDYVFTLAAESLGKKEIGAAEVSVGAKSFSTKPIHMNVVVAGKAPPAQAQNQIDPQNPFGDDDSLDPVDQMYQNLLKRRFDQMNGGGRGAGGNAGGFPPNPGTTRQIPGLNTDEAFFVREEQDKTTAYVGEQITASWYLYTRNAIRNIDTLKYPDLKGFWKEDIEIANRLNFQDEVVNGIPYKRALLVSYALFPIKEGPALIDSYKAKCDIAMGPFGMGQTMPFTKASADVKINILPLPTEGRPKDFTGAVGEFSVRTSIGSSKIETGQPFSFKIRIEGHGNAKPVDLPPLDLPASVELYDTRNETKFFKNGESYKEFEVLLIPRVAGPLKLPSVSIGVFDPKTKQYTQKAAPGLSINVGVGKAGEKYTGQSNLQNPSTNSKVAREALALPGPVTMTSVVGLNPHPGKIFWSALYGFIFFVLIAYGIRILGGGDRKRDLSLQLRKRLKAIQVALAKNDFRLVGTSGLNAINYIIGQHVEGEAGATHETVKLLRELPPSLRNALEKDLLRLIQYFESLSFAPESLLQDEKTQNRMKTETQDLERVLSRMIELGQENTAGGQQVVPS